MFLIREATNADNRHIAKIIRTVMPEYDCVGEGYSINDPEVDNMYEAFDHDGRKFYVVVRLADNKVLGCGGFAPLKGSDSSTICELQKMYFYSELRGYGMGKKLLNQCLDEAKKMGYQQMYLETVNRMTEAAKLYAAMGFVYLPQQLGNTGHSSCDRFMIRDL